MIWKKSKCKLPTVFKYQPLTLSTLSLVSYYYHVFWLILTSSMNFFLQISTILETQTLAGVWSFLTDPDFGILMMFRVTIVALAMFVGFPLLALKGPLGDGLIEAISPWGQCPSPPSTTTWRNQTTTPGTRPRCLIYLMYFIIYFYVLCLIDFCWFKSPFPHIPCPPHWPVKRVCSIWDN